MNEETKYALELIRRGRATAFDAEYLKGVIVKLEEEIESLKGELSESNTPVYVEALCTCRDGSCSCLLPKEE